MQKISKSKLPSKPIASTIQHESGKLSFPELEKARLAQLTKLYEPKKV